MARIRSVHPGLFTDEGFISVTHAARVLLLGIWTEADDNGVFEWKPIRLKIRLMPADSVNVTELLEELLSVNAITRFAVGEQTLGAVRNFRKWQRPKSPVTVHPLPDNIAKYVGSEYAKAADEQKAKRGTALGRILHERQDGHCFYCESEITFYRKKPNSLEIDHRLPVSRGGTDELPNLVGACRHCNSLKANMTDVEFAAKFSPSELRERHLLKNSGVAKNNSQPPKLVSGEIPPQREDGGGRREDGKKTDRGGRRAGVQVREPDPEPLPILPADLAGIEDALDGAAEPDMGVPVDLWKPRPGVDIDPENAADVKLLNQFAKHHMETGLFSRDWPTLWRKFHDDATRPKRAPPRVETNKRPEQPPGRRVVISDDAKAVASHIEQVCNLEHHPVTVGLPLLVETWLAAWPKELIVSVVTDVMRQRAANDQGPPRTMKYFETPIARAFEEAKRPAAGAAAKPKGTTGHDRRHANSTSAVAKRLAAEFEARDADKFVDGGEVLRVADGTVQAE